MIAYFYINKAESDEAVECGLKLSVYGSDMPEAKGVPARALVSLLSPKDEPSLYDDESLACMKLELPDDKLYIAEWTYADTGSDEWFGESLIPAGEYILGTYRKPRFVIPFTVLGGSLGILDKKRDVPVLYADSEELYIRSMFSDLEYKDGDFYNRALYGYLNVLQSGWKSSIEWQSDDLTVFGFGGKRYIIRNPDNEK